MQRYSKHLNAGWLLGAALVAIGCGDAPEADGASQSASIGSAETSGASASDTDATASVTDGDGADSSSGSTGESDSMTDGSSSSGSAEASSSGGPSCEQAGHQFMLEPSPPNVMLVLDKSRSMSNLWDHDNDPNTPEISRWNSLYNVVEALTADFGDRIHFGAQLFPSADAYLDEPTNVFSCLVNPDPEVAVGAGTGPAILAAMPPAGDFSISGGTPTTAGLQSALAHLTAIDGDAPRAILLITDGAANCSPDQAPEDTLFVYDEAVPATVAAAFGDHAIPTYVVGINILDELGTKPAVNPYEALTAVSDAGGVPAQGVDNFYNNFNELELTAALEAVANKIECTVSLPDEPQYPDLVGVAVDGDAWGQIDDCKSGDGWAYTSAVGPYNVLQLCGAACEQLQGGGTVQVDYNCPE